ncbi:MAG: hypothetical protein LCH52_09845 [Bacteroidetes bacterium]|nr:hypothetical protein [Bacteroidota bacterium]
MDKPFDCVEMKRKGARILQKKLAKLTLEEEIMFWAERAKKLEHVNKEKSLNQKKNAVSDIEH